MTAGHNGTQPPEGDDPFGYLYRQEGGQQAPAQQQGVPRTSYHDVRAVGERRYGQHQGHGPQAQPASGYGYPQGPPPGRRSGGYGYPQAPPAAPPDAAYPNAHYAAPETQPGGREAARRTAAAKGGGSGTRRNGLLIGALAVVGAVVIGVGAALTFSGDDDPGKPGTDAVAGDGRGGDDPGQQDEREPQPGDEQASDEKETAELPSEDASSLRLDNGPLVAGEVSGSKARDGKYVTGLDQPGATVTWSTEVPEAGTYRLYYGYTVPGKDMKLSLQVNDAAQPQNVNFKNFAHGPEGAWEKSWTYTYAEVRVDEGQNVFRLTCAEGDQCDVAVDRVWLAPDGG
ncbi:MULTISPECIES: hypothetical protein [Streptomyces]|uniref:hypothetical protein n=1 Tax=Streptomyces TaxID=1883 RepID=UPI00224996FF|nr:hypothetical protein [Streptomyces sp. JHD 1]MCX2968854.1 hypothetical protein [Streptomyces sp. JHD 1]